jgi:protein-S-isoprenylcysteine O-methyltransferase Ste14
MQALKNAGRISVPTAQLAIGAAAAVVLLLASLHVLSPEFDPCWRVVSEYANGNYGWVLSLMFAAGALSNWALGFAVWPQVHSRSGRTGLILLIISGIGGAWRPSLTSTTLCTMWRAQSGFLRYR